MMIIDHIRFFWNLFSFRLFLVLCLVFFSGLLESFGLMLFIPVLQIGLSQDSLDDNGETGLHEHLVLTVLQMMGVEDSIPGIMLLMLFFFVLKGAFILVFHSYSSYLKGDLLTQLRNRAFRGTISVSLLRFYNEPIGFYLNICNEQPTRVATAFMGLLRFISNLILSCIFIGMCFLLSPIFFIASIFVGFVVFVFYKGLNKTVNSLSKVIK